MKRLKSFWQNQTASVTVEFSLMVIVLCLIFAFTIDFVILRSDLGKLDRASYSALNVIKERKAFYARDDYTSQSEFDREAVLVAKIAARLLYGVEQTDAQLAKQDLGVVIEYVSFRAAEVDSTVAQSRQPMIRQYFVYRQGASTCQPKQPLEERVRQAKMAAYAETERFVPMFAVTLCMKQASFFKALTVSKDNLSGFDLRSTSVGIAR